VLILAGFYMGARVLRALAGAFSLRDVADVAGLSAPPSVIGLSSKNAILIIEFAKDLVAQGKDLIEATLQAVHLRFRPILMTSIAFILGVLPLVVSSGAGSASQRAIGTGVMGGMITATLLAIFFVPVFFVVVRRIDSITFKKPDKGDQSNSYVAYSLKVAESQLDVKFDTGRSMGPTRIAESRWVHRPGGPKQLSKACCLRRQLRKHQFPA
jgi:predicted RND superfamily exporter protein